MRSRLLTTSIFLSVRNVGIGTYAINPTSKRSLAKFVGILRHHSMRAPYLLKLSALVKLLRQRACRSHPSVPSGRGRRT
jgi:hypothetical protein